MRRMRTVSVQRAGRAVDLECAAASRDELAHDGVDPGLRGHDVQGNADQRGGAEPDHRERAQQPAARLRVGAAIRSLLADSGI
jgi:hypothetical protein